MPVTISGSSGITNVDGSAGTPANKGSTSATAGMFFPAANTVAFSTSSTEAMRIASTGNVGIGGTPSADTTYKWLNIIGPSTSGGGIVQLNNSDSSVGINMFCNNLAGYMGTSTNHPLLFRINSGEVARFDTSGNLLVGTTLGYAKAFIVQTANNTTFFTSTENGVASSYNYRCNINTIGQTNISVEYQGVQKGSIITNGSTTAFNTSSDYRLKNSVAPLVSGLSTVSALKPVTYKWNEDDSYGEGFIAHELAEVVPLAVSGEKDAVCEDGSIKPQGVDYSKIVVHLVAAIQEQQAQIEELKAKVATLEAK